MTNRCRPYLSVLFALAFILFGADESVVQAEARIGLRHPLGGIRASPPMWIINVLTIAKMAA
jgi:succinylarginine dihydrolase